MTQLLENAVTGTVLILATVLLRRLLKNRLSPGVWLALWAVCLFRLLTPAAPESTLSLYGLSPVPLENAPAAVGEVREVQAPAPIPDMNSAADAPVEPSLNWKALVLAAWLAASAALAVHYVMAWRLTRKEVRRTVLLGRDDPRYARLARGTALREGVMEGAPLTFGAVRPTIVLPPGLTGAELECVLAHEAVHARRRDNLWHYVMAAALVLYWWNPAVWLMARLLRRDVELSCDRAAVKMLGADRRADYARALVSLSTQAEGPAFCRAFGSKQTEERIQAVMKYKKMSICSILLALVLVFSVTAAFASNPKTEENGAQAPAERQDKTDIETEHGRDVIINVVRVPELGEGMEVYGLLNEDGAPQLFLAAAGQTAQAVSLEELEEMLNPLIADGSMTPEEKAQMMDTFQSILEDAHKDLLLWTILPDGTWVKCAVRLSR